MARLQETYYNASRLPGDKKEGPPPKEFHPGDPEQERKEIIERQPQNVLVICRGGQDRSRVIAQILNERGYHAWHKGVDGFSNALIQGDIDGAEAVIFAGEYMANKSINTYQFSENQLLRLLKLVESIHASKIRRGDGYEAEVAELIARLLDEMGFVDLNENELLSEDSSQPEPISTLLA